MIIYQELFDYTEHNISRSQEKILPQNGTDGFHDPASQVLESSPFKLCPKSQVKEAVVFSRYLPLYIADLS